MRNIIIIFWLIFSVLNISAQNDSNDGETRSERNAEFNKRPFKDKLAYGGELSMFFGTTSYINISPFIGYRLNPDITMGIGPSYQYWSQRFAAGPNGVYRTNIYGGRAFIRHELGPKFFMHAEYEILNLQDYIVGRGLGRVNVEMAGAGVGYKSAIDDFSYYYVMALFDFIQDPRSIYPLSPIVFKVGFMFGK
jgi:hypothetical protein